MSVGTANSPRGAAAPSAANGDGLARAAVRLGARSLILAAVVVGSTAGGVALAQTAVFQPAGSTDGGSAGPPGTAADAPRYLLGGKATIPELAIDPGLLVQQPVSGNNQASSSQTGSGNSASMDFQGSANVAQQKQVGTLNSLTMQATGNGNEVSVEQQGVLNLFNGTMQDGSVGNTIGALQSGIGNDLLVSVNGSDNRLQLSQQPGPAGGGNQLSVSVAGSGNPVNVDQVGDRLKASVQVFGNRSQPITINQVGSGGAPATWSVGQPAAATRR